MRSNSCQCCSSRTCCWYHLMTKYNTILNIWSVEQNWWHGVCSSLLSPFCWGWTSVWVEAPAHFSSYCFFLSFSFVFPVVSAPGSSVGSALSHLYWQPLAVHFSSFSLLDCEAKQKSVRPFLKSQVKILFIFSNLIQYFFIV